MPYSISLPPSMTDLLQLRLQVARHLHEAASMARKARPSEAQSKGRQDYVTDIDLMLDRHIQDMLRALTPNWPVYSEERTPEPMSAERYWIVDPLDGTLNLMAGINVQGIACALVDRNGPLLSLVQSVHDDRCYSAIRGQGAWVNEARLHVPDMPPATVVLSTGLLDKLVAADGTAYTALRDIGKIRNLGAQSLHLCGVASGMFAAVLSVEARIWDEAAAGLIVREAGGHWHSNADHVDWMDPLALMLLPRQESIAAHPAVRDRAVAAVTHIYSRIDQEP